VPVYISRGVYLKISCLKGISDCYEKECVWKCDKTFYCNLAKISTTCVVPNIRLRCSEEGDDDQGGHEDEG